MTCFQTNQNSNKKVKTKMEKTITLTQKMKIKLHNFMCELKLNENTTDEIREEANQIINNFGLVESENHNEDYRKVEILVSGISDYTKYYIYRYQFNEQPKYIKTVVGIDNARIICNDPDSTWIDEKGFNVFYGFTSIQKHKELGILAVSKN